MSLCILDVQHGLAPGRPDSRGARTPTGLWERDLTRHYAAVAMFELVAMGWTVELWPDRQRTYAERHALVLRRREALASGRVVYVACHLDDVTWPYGCAYYDGRSARGKRLAGELGEALEAHCPELSSGRATPCWSAARPGEPTAEGDSSLHWTSRAQACIGGVWRAEDAVEAVTFEPACLRTPRHVPLWSTLDGLGRIGKALARGVVGQGP